MNILDGIRIVDHGFFIENTETLIISDIHLGKGESLKIQGLLLPKKEFPHLKKRINALLDTHQPEEVVINGDLKHNFGRFTYKEWKQVKTFLDLIKEDCDVRVVKGNHDKILNSAVEKADLTLHDHVSLGNIYITHGHEIPDDDGFDQADTVIIGHVHPAVSVGDGIRSEKYQCFLKNTYEGKNIISPPAFNDLSEGVDLLRDKVNTPFISRSTLMQSEIFIYQDGEVFDFGTLDSIRQRAR